MYNMVEITSLTFPLYALPAFLFSVFKHDLHTYKDAATGENHESHT
jgi:hypothetical protein